MVRGAQITPGSGATAAGPVRTCVGCRRRGPREDLLRFVVDGRGHLRADPTRRAAGRGTHVCPNPRCIALGLKQGFARSLKRRIAAEESERFVVETRAALVAAAVELETRARCDGRVREGAVEPGVQRQLELLRAQALELGSTPIGEPRPKVV